MHGSLDELSSILPQDNEYLNKLLKESLIGDFVNPRGLEQFLRKKGRFPFSELTDLHKLNSVKKLFPIESFYNDLKGEECPED